MEADNKRVYFYPLSQEKKSISHSKQYNQTII